jgi:hypothetical protein
MMAVTATVVSLLFLVPRKSRHTAAVDLAFSMMDGTLT